MVKADVQKYLITNFVLFLLLELSALCSGEIIRFFLNNAKVSYIVPRDLILDRCE